LPDAGIGPIEEFLVRVEPVLEERPPELLLYRPLTL